MASTLRTLIKALSGALQKRSTQLRGATRETDFFAGEKSIESIFKLFDRSGYVEKLHALDKKSGPTKEWVANYSPVEFMAGLERDTRARYRSRLDHYRVAATTKRLPPIFFERYQKMIEQLQG